MEYQMRTESFIEEKEQESFIYNDLNKDECRHDLLLALDIPRLFGENQISIARRLLNAYFNYNKTSEYYAHISCILCFLINQEQDEIKVFANFLKIMKVWQEENE